MDRVSLDDLLLEVRKRCETRQPCETLTEESPWANEIWVPRTPQRKSRPMVSDEEATPSKAARRRARPNRVAVTQAQKTNLCLVSDHPELLPQLSLLPDHRDNKKVGLLRPEAPEFVPSKRTKKTLCLTELVRKSYDEQVDNVLEALTERAGAKKRIVGNLATLGPDIPPDTKNTNNSSNHTTPIQDPAQTDLHNNNTHIHTRRTPHHAHLFECRTRVPVRRVPFSSTLTVCYSRANEELPFQCPRLHPFTIFTRPPFRHPRRAPLYSSLSKPFDHRTKAPY